MKLNLTCEQWATHGSKIDSIFNDALEDLATLFAEVDRLIAQLAEREGIARELALALRAVELARHTDEEIHWVDATKKTEAALARFHAAEGE